MIDASGHRIPELLDAILKFFPLDTYVFNLVVLLDLVNGQNTTTQNFWKSKRVEISKHIFNII